MFSTFVTSRCGARVPLSFLAPYTSSRRVLQTRLPLYDRFSTRIAARQPRRTNRDDNDDDDESSFFSLQDLDRLRQDRPVPPTLDSALDDAAFGALDYQLDAYDLEAVRHQEAVAQQFFRSSHRNEKATNLEDNNEISSSMYEVIPADDVSTSRLPGNGNYDSTNSGASGYGGASTSGSLDELEQQLEKLTQEIIQENNGVEFNLDSAKQVALILFGPGGGSTEKTVLEAKAAAGYRMAALMLQYRALKQTIRRLKRKEDNIAKGTQVRRATSVARNATFEEDSDPLMLVDASNYIFRAYFSMPPIHRSDGMPTGAVMGFCNMLNKLTLDALVDGETPRLVLVFDAKGGSFRQTLYGAYKANRPEAPVDLIPQFDLVRQAAKAYGICQIEAASYEADDVIATLVAKARAEGLDVNIFSSDKDLMQLVSDKGEVPSVHMIDPVSMSRVTYDEVVEKWGVPPKLLGDVLALAGDSADNVPGVPGIGPKTAAQLIQEFGTLESLLDQTDKIKQQGRRAKLEEYAEQARISRKLVELVSDVPMDIMTFPPDIDRVDMLRTEPLNQQRILEFYDNMGFQETKRRFLNSIQNGRLKIRRPNRQKRPKATIPKPEDYSDVPF